MRRLLRRHTARRGQGIVEMALALPIFLALTLGMIDGGRMIWCYVTLSHAVQEGGRKAILADTSGDGVVKTTVSNASDPLAVPTTNVTVQVNDRASGATKTYANRVFGDRVTVEASYGFQPVVTMIFGEVTINLRAETEVMAE